MKVMLVEDDDLVRATLADGLVDAGIQVAEYSDPKPALETVNQPDLVITDVDLGSTLSGFDVAATAHVRWPSVNVVLISGQPVDRRRLDPRDRYLQIPLSSRHLLQAIAELPKAA